MIIQCECQQAVDVRGFDRNILGQRSGASITRCHIELAAQWRHEDEPRQSMLAPTAADEQYLQFFHNYLFV
jgi:hypothetical protein